MLRLRDTRAGQPAPISPVRQGRLSIYVAARGAGGFGDLDSLRTLILADLIGRIARRHGLQVHAWRDVPDDEAAAWAAFNIYPAEFAERPPDPLDIRVGASRSGPQSSPGARWVRAGRVLTSSPTPRLGDLDPLSYRLGLLTTRYSDQLRLTADDLAGADQELRLWRAQVAEWATFPSRPMSARRLAEIIDAFDDDVDTPAVLRGLRALAADAEIPPGEKFETLAHLDQILGLDLARDVGR